MDNVSVDSWIPVIVLVAFDFCHFVAGYDLMQHCRSSLHDKDGHGISFLAKRDIPTYLFHLRSVNVAPPDSYPSSFLFLQVDKQLSNDARGSLIESHGHFAMVRLPRFSSAAHVLQILVDNSKGHFQRTCLQLAILRTVNVWGHIRSILSKRHIYV